MGNKLYFCQVSLIPLEQPTSGELSDDVFRKCHFCEKSCQFSSEQLQLIHKLSGLNNFYCPFCLRHNLHTKANRDVLILSFRSIIGYFYFQNYLFCNNSKNKFWISEIEDFIKSHQQAGYVNPLFLYDPESMLWFVDFSKVGQGKNKLPLDEIVKTILSILTSFNLSKIVPNLNLSTFFQKYKEAIEDFYESRYQKILIPTFDECGVQDPYSFSFNCTRNFIFKDLEFKNKIC